MPTTRRDALLLGLGAVTTACASSPASTSVSGSETATLGLDEIARRKGLRYGSAIAAYQLRDPGYLQVIKRDCGVLVSENEHKWYALHKRPDGYDFEAADTMMAWAKKEGIGYRGHCFVWNRDENIPAWVKQMDFGADKRAAAEKLIVDHINAVCAHYPTITSWDVVNETISEKTGLYRDTVFTRTIGEETIDTCFHAAHAAAPQAQLVYNDFMSWDPNGAPHRDGVLRYLEKWKKRNLPIHAFGVQAHIWTDKPADAFPGFYTAREKIWRAYMDEVTAMGFDILITEFDVADRNLPADPAVRDAAVAACTKGYLDLMLSYPQVKQVLSWGMVDKFSWLSRRGAMNAEDGSRKRPLPYDDDYRPKPMRTAIAEALAAAPWRKPG